MSLLTGPARFNGSNGEYSLLLDRDRFEREIRIGPLSMWDALIDGAYWQSNFGSPVYRRPGPFSTQEATQWHEIWQHVLAARATEGTSDRNWEITSIVGNTNVEFSKGSLRATTDIGNVTEYGPATIQSTALATLRPAPPERIDFSLPFDLSIGVPRAKLMIGDRQIQVIVDTGADHSIFASSLPHEELGVTAKVHGAGGVVDFTLGRLRDVRIGETPLEEITPFFDSFEQMPPALRLIRGIVGQDILGRSAVTFDHRRGVIVGKKESEHTLAWPLDGSYTMAVVDGKRGWYRIDTGSAFTLHLFTNDLLTPGGEQHQGVGGAFHARPTKIGSLQLDEVELSNIRGYLQQTTDDPDVIAGNIGQQLLKDMRITMDFSRGLARFSKLS